MPVMMNSINVANKHMQYAALQKGQKFHSDTSDFDDPDHGSYTWNLMNVLLFSYTWACQAFFTLTYLWMMAWFAPIREMYVKTAPMVCVHQVCLSLKSPLMLQTIIFHDSREDSASVRQGQNDLVPVVNPDET